MQYYIYQHADGTNDVSPYKPFEDSATKYRQENQDAMIMRARCNASSRGATPVEIQRIVESLA